MVGIERGTPDVSIAREMDIPLHRVLFSGLVYARARHTTGPWLNRCEEEPIRAAARVGVYADVIDSVLLFVVRLVSLKRSEKLFHRLVLDSDQLKIVKFKSFEKESFMNNIKEI